MRFSAFLFVIVAFLVSNISSRKFRLTDGSFRDLLVLDLPSNVAPVNYVCFQVMDPGVCSKTYQAWYYDIGAQRCKTFTWTGCGGNMNRFAAKGECQFYCESKRTIYGT